MGEIFRQEHAASGLDEPADERIARLHRYYLARQLARGRSVLDLQGGDGSGAALMAQVASSVVAMVREPAAAAARFRARNLEFRLGTSVVPAEVEPADIVLAFGLVERQADPAEFVAGLRQVLRPGGRLLVDAADPQAELGAGDTRHRFAADELAALLRRGFGHVRVLRQLGLIGSVLAGGEDGVPALVFAHRDRLHVEASAGVAQADSCLCVASDAPLDDVVDSLFIDADVSALAAMQARAVQAAAERDALRQSHNELAAEVGRNRRSDAQWRHDLAVLRVNEAAAANRAEALVAERDGFAQGTLSVVARLERDAQAAASLAERLGAAQAESARLRAALDEQPQQRPGLYRRLRRTAGRLLPGNRARVDAMRGNALFDAAWYLARYPDIVAAGLDPARHYVAHGAAEGRDPGPGFDAAWYAREHPELAASGLTAVEFQARHGVAAGWPTAAPAAVEVVPTPNPRVLFISGESDTPGSQYRCVRYAEAAAAAGWSAGWSKLEETGAIELIGVEIAVLWRVRYSKHVEGVMREIRNAGGTVVFDVDDLMIRPELARTSVIDGIRTTNAGIGSTRETFAQVQQAMLHADLCTTTTQELARHMREFQKAAYVLPNGYDAAALARSRLAVRRRAQAGSDGLIRIGYAAGTVTHQKDFAVALPGILRVLETRPRVRLVLFRAKDGPDLVVIDEFEALAAFADRIEWRDKVSLAELPAELARFDINIAPLELGNPFCEAKSELKYFEASLVSVPTVASPSGPFARAIVHGRTGMLAADDEAWQQSLLRLVDDAEFRQVVGRRAYIDCIWPFGPQRRTELVDAFLQQISGTAAGARAFALQVAQDRERGARIGAFGVLQGAHVLHRTDRLGGAEVTVIVPCYNYADTIIEALESVRLQTLQLLDLVVVDDCSTDPLAGELILEWARRHDERFNRLVVVRHVANAGLSAARNTGFDLAETAFVLPLDADNRLRPECCAALLGAMHQHKPAYAYSSVQMFGAADSVFCNERYQPVRFVGGNYIDAMAMIAKWAWAAAGGYDMPRSMGWEDFDLWCRLAELGQRGVHVADVLAEYRLHDTSMVSTMVEVEVNKQKMVELVEQRHDWLRLSSRKPHERV